MSDASEVRDRGRPLIATVVAALFLLLMAAYGSESVSERQSAPYLLGYFGGGAALIWGLAYAVTIRKASLGWKIGSFAAIAAVAALSAWIALTRAGAPTTAFREDMRDTARRVQQAMDRGDDPPGRIEGGAGPMSRMSAAFLNGVLADRGAFDRETQVAGLT